MSKAIVVSFSQFAFGLGKQGRLLRESSIVWHKEYVQADSATRKEKLHECVKKYFTRSRMCVSYVGSNLPPQKIVSKECEKLDNP
jgi:hypothetical protein